MKRVVLKWRERNDASFVFSTFSSFLLAWPVRRPLMHDRCRYQGKRTRSAAEPSLEKSFLPPTFSLLSPLSKSFLVSHSFSDLQKFVHEKSRKLDRVIATTIPANVLQMNDQPESHKPFFSKGDPSVERQRNFKIDIRTYCIFNVIRRFLSQFEWYFLVDGFWEIGDSERRNW